MLPETKNKNRIEITEKKPMVNTYYLTVSNRFKMAKYISACVLVVYLLAAVILFRDEITVENLRYLFKDLEMGESSITESSDVIKYDADIQVQLAAYKGDLVVAGSSYFYLCDLQGNKRLNEASTFSNPIVLTGDKYLLVYGLSEHTYTIYNAFAQLHTGTTEYPITHAALSNKGMYAIVTRTSEYRSVVYLYNENFKQIGAVYKDKYIFDIKFNNDGSELLITSVYSKNGNFCTEIMNYVPYSEAASSSFTTEGSLPLKTGYNSNGGYSIVYDDKIEFYDSEFVLRNSYTYAPGVVPLTAEITDEYTIITYNENIVGDTIKLLAFTANGEKVLDITAEGQAKKLRCDGKYVYVLFDGMVGKVSISGGSMEYYDTERNAIELLVVNEKNVLVCFNDHTAKVNTAK